MATHSSVLAWSSPGTEKSRVHRIAESDMTAMTEHTQSCFTVLYFCSAAKWITYMYIFIPPSLVAQMVKKLPAMKETQVRSFGQEDSWTRKWLPLQYSCLENTMDRGTWQATVHGVEKSRTRLSDSHFNFIHIFTLFKISFPFRSPQSIE